MSSNVCGYGTVNGVGGALDASERTETKQGTAVYVSKAGETPLRFTSYAEKYAYMRGKSNCTGSSFPCWDSNAPPS